jgi:hypothetical protein
MRYGGGGTVVVFVNGTDGGRDTYSVVTYDKYYALMVRKVELPRI